MRKRGCPNDLDGGVAGSSTAANKTPIWASPQGRRTDATGRSKPTVTARWPITGRGRFSSSRQTGSGRRTSLGSAGRRSGTGGVGAHQPGPDSRRLEAVAPDGRRVLPGGWSQGIQPESAREEASRHRKTSAPRKPAASRRTALAEPKAPPPGGPFRLRMVLRSLRIRTIPPPPSARYGHITH